MNVRKVQFVKDTPFVRAFLLVACFLLMSSSALSLMGAAGSKLPSQVALAGFTAATPRTPVEKITPQGPGSDPETDVSPSSPQALEPPAVLGGLPYSLDVYRGLGAWVDQYDLGADFDQVAAEMARRKVKTLYLQTGRWNLPEDVANPSLVGAYLDAAHRNGIAVVGWYLPGFVDIERDLRRSKAVLDFVTPSGNGFDGFAPDIEDARETGGQLGRFHQGIADYSARLRQLVPPGTALGAIVPDAKNNERAPGRWAGFPWPQIAMHYDVALPMAYWSVTKKGDCLAQSYDASGYLAEVVTKTHLLSGRTIPVHAIGGIANCTTPGEVAAFVNATGSGGWLGASLYDFRTTQTNPHREAIWAELARL